MLIATGVTLLNQYYYTVCPCMRSVVDCCNVSGVWCSLHNKWVINDMNVSAARLVFLRPNLCVALREKCRHCTGNFSA